jgi:hypothetical protein
MEVAAYMDKLKTCPYVLLNACNGLSPGIYLLSLVVDKTGNL